MQPGGPQTIQLAGQPGLQGLQVLPLSALQVWANNYSVYTCFKTAILIIIYFFPSECRWPTNSHTPAASTSSTNFTN